MLPGVCHVAWSAHRPPPGVRHNGRVTYPQVPHGTDDPGDPGTGVSGDHGHELTTEPSADTVLAGYRNGRLHSDAAAPTVLRTDFDVDAYVHAARGRIPVDLGTASPMGADPHDDSLRRDLAFVWRLDSAGLSETRAVLTTWTSNEARITAFIATWAYERFWFARAARDLLTADGDVPRAPRRGLRGRLRGLYVERILPVVAPIWTTIVGEPVVAGHMARLAVQESALQAAYRALLPRLSGEAHRVVSEIVHRRDTVVEFFRTEAAARISRSRAEAAAARVHLGTGWAPLRIVGVPDTDERRALSSIFRTAAARADLAEAIAAVQDLLPPRRERGTLSRALAPLRRLTGRSPRSARRDATRGL